MKVDWFGKSVRGRGEYACTEDFFSVFECERKVLQRLAFLLTANSEAAKRCLIRALRECTSCSSVSREWVLRWTRRIVIRVAINLVMSPEGKSIADANDDVDNGLIAFSPDDLRSTIGEFELILNLPELDRFVFVICVLECYSMHDCALLLGKSIRDINEARQRVRDRVGETDRHGIVLECVAMCNT